MLGRLAVGNLVFLGQVFFAGNWKPNQQFCLVSRHKLMSTMETWVKTLLPSLAKVFSNTCRYYERLVPTYTRILAGIAPGYCFPNELKPLIFLSSTVQRFSDMALNN